MLVTVLLAACRTKEAIAMLDASLQTRKHVLGPKASAIADSEIALGEAYLVSGDPAKAEAMARAGLELHEEIRGKNSPGGGDARIVLAATLLREERWQEAADMAEETLTIDRAAFPEGHPIIGAAEMVLGKVKMHLGQAGLAAPLFQDAVGQFGRSFGDRTPQTAAAREWLARAQATAGQRNEAKRTIAGQAEILSASADPRFDEERSLAEKVRQRGISALMS